ncbi:uncharacterized protein LOC124631487 isoform X1 [Helicoverpa zea]|uniref:uncharacterized protein LOC124631487 isoform X1 n=1 Tax=Helicoverpa zea TaxID=7113 RepID=UPI001F5645B4|nr:uncharacterized protein LOC124631487 isoform X1 [Helicoverpa zea]
MRTRRASRASACACACSACSATSEPAPTCASPRAAAWPGCSAACAACSACRRTACSAAAICCRPTSRSRCSTATTPSSAYRTPRPPDAPGDVNVHFIVLSRVVPVSTKVDTVPAEDVSYAPVDAAPMATGELERSPSPDRVDVLTETKRQALLILEQYSAKPAPVGQDAPDGQDTPDGQDASSAPDGQDAPGASDDCDTPARPRRRRVRRRRRVAPLAEPAPGDGDRAAPGSGDCAAVLRNELQPRAPRVVRPLPPAAPLSCLALPLPIADFT